MHIHNKLKNLLAVGLFALVAMPASGQSAYENMSPEWWESLEAQLTESVASDIAQVRHETLRHIVFFAENYEEHIALDDAAYRIMGQFEVSDDVSERLLALAALSAIGEEMTMQRLAEIADAERSPRVRSMTAAVLQAHAASL